MAEEMEKAQKALRVMDYDSMSEDGDDEEDGKVVAKSPPRTTGNFHQAVILPSPEVSLASASSLEKFLSYTDIEENNDDEKTRGVISSGRHENICIDTSHPYTQMNMSMQRNHNTESTHMMATTTNMTPLRHMLMSVSSPKQLENPPGQNALIDDDNLPVAFSVELQTFETDGNKDDSDYCGMRFDAISNNKFSTSHSSTYPGTAGFLEMEEEPPREIHQEQTNSRNYNIDNNSTFEGESIRTDSGLILTHRKNTNQSTNRNKPLHENGIRGTQQNYFEVESDAFDRWNKDETNFHHRKGINNHSHGSHEGLFDGRNGKHSMAIVQFKRLMSYVKIWILLFVSVLFVMTGVFFHSMGREEGHNTSVKISDSSTSKSLQSTSLHEKKNENILPDEILLLPLTDISNLRSPSLEQQQQGYNHHQLQNNYPRRLKSHYDISESDSFASSHHFVRDLHQEFENWIKDHGKAYHSNVEKEHRFSIWSRNHRRTIEKNSRHGPCTLTKQHVFGSNQFKDLAPEEFQRKFLTGYKGEFTDILEMRQQDYPPSIRKLRKNFGIGMVLHPTTHNIKIHESVAIKQRHLKQNSSRYKPQVMGSSSVYCKWYDLSCFLRYVWQSTGIQFGNLVGTMEPKYDADAFPNSVDWRDSGAITDVRTQGECGACWAVTAVETVESANFIATGTLYELSESEIIVCDDSCEMCSGGWPQNAYEWVMDHGGLPLQSTLPYDAYTLISLTAGLNGESEYYDEETVNSYRAEVCPANYDSRSGSHSNDNSYWEDGMENENYVDYSEQGRYGNIKGYGYATDRCLCYTDGSGCDCDDQDEDTAVRNIATYGPAAVCLEASTWQDYAGGIMTSSIGCGQEFLDMNHCVQVVGYAFTTSTECNGQEDCKNSHDNESGSGSGSNSKSGDSNGREGYWIVRNQWGESWGMNGYAYISMGANTCGILNDMTIAYA